MFDSCLYVFAHVDNAIGDSGAESIGSALCVNMRLQHLSLKGKTRGLPLAMVPDFTVDTSKQVIVICSPPIIIIR